MKLCPTFIMNTSSDYTLEFFMHTLQSGSEVRTNTTSLSSGLDIGTRLQVSVNYLHNYIILVTIQLLSFELSYLFLPFSVCTLLSINFPPPSKKKKKMSKDGKKTSEPPWLYSCFKLNSRMLSLTVMPLITLTQYDRPLSLKTVHFHFDSNLLKY